VATPAVRSRIEANPGGGGHRAADFDSVRATGYENLGGFASHTFWLDSGDAKIYHGEGVFSPEVRRTVAQRKRLGPQPWVRVASDLPLSPQADFQIQRNS